MKAEFKPNHPYSQIRIIPETLQEAEKLRHWDSREISAECVTDLHDPAPQPRLLLIKKS